jgi:hypothetical protein
VLQQRRLAIGIAHGTVAVGLHARDIARQPGPLAQGRHQHRINVVEALSQPRQILTRHHILTIRPPRKGSPPPLSSRKEKTAAPA